MKAILEFNLSEDELDFDMAIKGSKYYSALWEMDQWLRSQIKYNDKLSDEQHAVYQLCRDELRECMDENGVSFNN